MPCRAEFSHLPRKSPLSLPEAFPTNWQLPRLPFVELTLSLRVKWWSTPFLVSVLYKATLSVVVMVYAVKVRNPLGTLAEKEKCHPFSLFKAYGDKAAGSLTTNITALHAEKVSSLEDFSHVN